MGYHVVKPFKSLTRRHAAGDPITAADIDPGSATSFDVWLARGFIAADAPPAPAKVGRGANKDATTAE